MKRQPWILAGTALGLLMSGPSFAAALMPLVPASSNASPWPLIRVQDEAAPAAEEPAVAPEATPAPEAEAEQPRRKRREQAQEQQAEPDAQPAQEEEAQPRRQRRERAEQQEEAAPQAEQPADQEEQPTRRQRRQQSEEQQQEQSAPAESQGEQVAPTETEQQPQSRRERERQRRQQQQEQQQTVPETAPTQPEPVQPETPPASEPAPNAEQPQATPAPEGEQQPQSRRERERQRRQQQEQQQTVPEAAPAQPTPGTEATPPATGAEQPAPTPAPDTAPAQPPAAGSETSPAQPPVQPGAAPQPGQPAPADGNAGAQPPVALPPGEAPASPDAVQRPARGGQAAQPAAPVAPAAPAGPPPQNDAAAQPETIIQQQIAPVTQERGERRREGRSPNDDPSRRERPQGADVLRQLGDRTIIQFNNQTIVESNEQPRLTRGARDVYYEDLPRQRTRETVVREDGTQVVTVRNRYGDVVRRSRITPDGREYVLSYVNEDDRERVRDWRDPGLDLPPLQLSIPQEDYILDARRIGSNEDPDEEYYEFLDQPPVERVERLYSVDEVKRSSRIRQKTRRIDLDTINFEFGSASVPESQVNKLEGVASAMEKLLQRNPAETFLIEGHTDAVGSDVANLALSDRRAESVADALTNVFGIPPENLTTQGYGEQYLKVNTPSAEAQNRRVAIRRITALVAPATANAK